MYIQQTTLFSFEEIIKFQEQTKLELVLSQIDISKPANAIGKPSSSKDPTGYEPKNLIYSLIATQAEKIQSTKDLVTKLNNGPVLRYYCGFKVPGRIPSESTFSRFFNKLSDSEEFE